MAVDPYLAVRVAPGGLPGPLGGGTHPPSSPPARGPPPPPRATPPAPIGQLAKATGPHHAPRHVTLPGGSGAPCPGATRPGATRPGATPPARGPPPP